MTELAKITELEQELDALQNNDPQGIVNLTLEHLNKASNGEIEVLDTNTPFVTGLQLQATIAVDMRNRLDNSEYNVVTAPTAEVSRYLTSDINKLMFGSPSYAKFKFLINVKDLLHADGSTYTIPAHSIVYDVANNIDYMLERDLIVYIDKYNDELYTVLYGNNMDEETSTVISATTRIYDKQIEGGEKHLYFELELPQLSLSTTNLSMTESENIEITIPYRDYINKVVVSTTDDSGKEKLLPVIYTLDTIKDVGDSDYVYVHNTGTAIILTMGNFTRTVNSDYINVAVYTTKGGLRVDYHIEDKFNIILPSEQEERNIIAKVVSDFYGVSGYDGISLEEARTKLLNNFNYSTPLTSDGLKATMFKKGLLVGKSVSSLYSRTYIASDYNVSKRNINIDPLVNTNMCSVDTSFPLKNVNNIHGIITYPGVAQITNEAVYRLADDNTCRLLTKDEYNEFNVESSLLKEFNANELMVSPFRYMIDLSSDVVEVKAYYMEEPSIDKVNFYYTNLEAKAVAVIGIDITSYSDGYRLVMECEKSDDNQPYDVWVDFKGNRVKAVELLGVESEGRVFELLIDTDKTVKNNKIILSNVSNTEHTYSVIDLAGSLNINIVSKISTMYSENRGLYPTENNLGSLLYSSIRVNYTLGTYLPYLWVGDNITETEFEYKVSDEDVPLLYENNIYEDMEVDSTTCDITYNKLHSVGDPVLDANGDQVYKYRKGDFIRDEAGNKIITGYVGLVQNYSACLMDLVTIRPNNVSDSFNVKIKDIIAQSTVNFERYNKELLENTNMYYVPRGVFKTVPVKLPNGEYSSIDRQGITVNVYILVTKKPTSVVLDKISTRIKELVYDVLNTETVNLADIKVSDVGYDNILTSLSVVPIVDTSGKSQMVFTYTDNRHKLVPSNSVTKTVNGYVVSPGVEVAYNFI